MCLVFFLLFIKKFALSPCGTEDTIYFNGLLSERRNAKTVLDFGPVWRPVIHDQHGEGDAQSINFFCLAADQTGTKLGQKIQRLLHLALFPDIGAGGQHLRVPSGNSRRDM